LYKHKSAFFSHSKGVYVSKKKIWEKKKKKKFSKEKISVKPKKRDIKALSKLGLIKEGTFIGNHKGFGFVDLYPGRSYRDCNAYGPCPGTPQK